MALRSLASLVSFGCVVAVGFGCSRADVYPVTLARVADGGPGEGGPGDGGPGDGGPGDGGPGDAGDGGDPPAGCPSTPAQPGDTRQTLVVDGMTRSYVLHVPASYDGAAPVPLVVDFHGIGSSGMAELESSPYPARLDPEGVVMAFPDGVRGPAGTAWNVGPCCVEDVDDLAFARALVADVSERACIDPARVYAVGLLTGGGMAYHVACQAADVFAAVSPAAFDMLEETVDDCVPARPITVVSFRGTAISRVPYEGGPSSAVPGLPVTFLGAQGSFEAWARINGCAGAPSEEDANGCSSYSSCREGAEVILCTKQDGTEEPGDPDIAWPVLARHRL